MCTHGHFWLLFTVILSTLNNIRQCFYQSKTVDSFWPVNVLTRTTRKVWQCLTFKCTRYTLASTSKFLLILTLVVVGGLLSVNTNPLEGFPLTSFECSSWGTTYTLSLDVQTVRFVSHHCSMAVILYSSFSVPLFTKKNNFHWNLFLAFCYWLMQVNHELHEQYQKIKVNLGLHDNTSLMVVRESITEYIVKRYTTRA